MECLCERCRYETEQEELRKQALQSRRMRVLAERERSVEPYLIDDELSLGGFQ